MGENGISIVGVSMACPKKNEGITLVALIVTIIVLLILARSKYKCGSRRKWNTKKSKKRNRRNNSSRI